MNGNTALHAAVEGDHEDMCKFLVENGAKLDIKNKYGHTAIDTALLLNRLNVALLIQNDKIII